MVQHQHRPLGRLVLLLATLVLGGSGAVGADPAGPDPALDPIVKAWKHREQDVTTLRCDYTTHWINMPGFNEASEKVEGVRRTRFWIDGRRMRYEVTGQLFSQGKLEQTQLVSSYDGKRNATLSAAHDEIFHPQGFVQPGNSCEVTSVLDARPLTWTFFATDPGLAMFDVTSWKLLPEKTTVAGVECLVAEQQLKSPNGRPIFPAGVERFFLDPDKSYSIIRYTFGGATASTIQIDCSYNRSPDSQEWLPAAWTTWRFGSEGQPLEVGTAKVEMMETPSTFAADAFRISFPPGTVVSDLTRQDNIGRSGTYDYIVRADGSERQITWEERFADHERLMKTETGGAGVQRHTPHRYLLVLINGIGLALIAVIFFLRNRLPRATPSDAQVKSN